MTFDLSENDVELLREGLAEVRAIYLDVNPDRCAEADALDERLCSHAHALCDGPGSHTFQLRNRGPVYDGPGTEDALPPSPLPVLYGEPRVIEDRDIRDLPPGLDPAAFGPLNGDGENPARDMPRGWVA